MKYLFASVVLAAAVIAAIVTFGSNDGLQGASGMPGSALGKWILLDNESSAVFAIRSVEFVDSHSVICTILDQGGATYNVQFRYDYVGESRIHVSAPRRIASDWEVSDQNGKLVVRGDPWPYGTGVFKRIGMVSWPPVAFLVGLLAIGAFLVPIPQTKMVAPQVESGEMGDHRRRETYRYIGRNVVALLCFAGGVSGGYLIWSSPSLLGIRLPWDAVITLELGLGFSIVAIRMLLAGHRRFMQSSASPAYFLASALIAAGILGAIIGAGRLFLFIETGHYP